jgi:hypothetical protein
MGGELPRQPAGLIAQVAADRHVAMSDVAAVTEKELDGREDRIQPSAKLGRSRRVRIHVQLAKPISSAKCASSGDDSRSATSARRGNAWEWVCSRRGASIARLRAVQ